MPLRTPITRLGKRQPARYLPVADPQLPVLIHPPLSAEQIVNARRHLVPSIQIPRPRQQNVHLPHRLELHALPPELRLDPGLLPEGVIFPLGVAGADRRVMRHLLGDETEALVLPHALVRLSQQGIERLVARAAVRARVRRNGERGDVHHSLVRIVDFRRLIQQLGVL